MTIKNIGHWLGQRIEYLPGSVKQIITNHFTIIEHNRDISILSAPDLTLAFFYFAHDQQKSELEMALKICTNLNKQLVIIHHGALYPWAQWVHAIKAVIDLSKAHSPQKIDDLIRSLSYAPHLRNVMLNPKSDHPTRRYHTSNEKSLFDILHYIDHNLHKSLRADEIAAYFHYSPSYFSKVFRQTIGISFKTYLCNQRIAKAKEMLRNHHNDNISHIAYQCGYQDVSYFSRLFKKITGITPGTYRQQQERTPPNHPSS
jgi:AraC-like DNA-binding protein